MSTATSTRPVAWTLWVPRSRDFFFQSSLPHPPPPPPPPPLPQLTVSGADIRLNGSSCIFSQKSPPTVLHRFLLTILIRSTSSPRMTVSFYHVSWFFPSLLEDNLLSVLVLVPSISFPRMNLYQVSRGFS